MKLRNDNGLFIVVEEDGSESCLGYLFNFQGHGIFAPTGKLDITPQQAETHNKMLSEGELLGLDKCEVGQWGTLYHNSTKGVVVNFIGTVVAPAQVKGQSITFQRNGKTFRGRLQKNADCFNFKRVK